MKQEGNRGYLLGTAPEREEEVKTTRDTYVFEVEFGKGSKTGQPKSAAPQKEAVVESAEGEVAEVEYVVDEVVVEDPIVIEVEPDFK